MDMLPDDVLLSIFDLCANEQEGWQKQVWETLVHVCRRWRSLVFGSPRSLNLQLICTSRTSARNMLDVWPPLPLNIVSIHYANVDNIIALLEHRNRVCRIYIRDISSLNMEKVSAVMQEPFPELTGLHLYSNEITMSALPDLFLGGSAPRLRSSIFKAFHFRDYRNYFCLQLTSPVSTFPASLIPDISHPRRWPLPSPR